MAGDLTATHYGCFSVSGSALIAAINTINLAAATDFIKLVPVANGTQIAVIKIVRAA